MTSAPNKKLIEVSLPLEAINAALKAEKSRKVGKPQQVHHWWARRPITAARAVLFAQLVDDPSSHPDRFPTVESQDMERARLHHIIERLVRWDSAYDAGVLQEAKNEILRSTDGRPPTIIDPFAGGGSIPLEAQRLGLPAIASDLNPVATLINLALIDLPARFSGRAPVHPSADERQMSWLGAQGLAADLREYGNWVRAELSERLRHLYPDVVDETGTPRRVISWVWARTVRSPNPSNPIQTPLVRTWWLSKKKGKEAYIVPELVDGEVHYSVRTGADGPRGDDEWTIKHPRGAKAVGDGTPFGYDYIRAEGKAGRMGDQLIAIVAEGPRGRIYLPPSAEQERVARVSRPSVPGLDQLMSTNARWFSPPQYGLDRFEDLFTPRQLTALKVLTELIPKARARVLADAVAAGPCASGWGETPALLTFALHGARTDQY